MASQTIDSYPVELTQVPASDASDRTTLHTTEVHTTEVQATEVHATDRELAIGTSNGAAARRVDSPQGEQLEILDSKQRLVFRFDPQTGQATLNVPQGNLRLICEQGDIEMHAAGTIRTRSDQVEIQARKSLSLTVLNRLGQVFSRLFFEGGRGRLKANSFEQQTESLHVKSQESRLDAERHQIVVKEQNTKANSIRTKAERVDEQLGQRISAVEGLDYQKAGRLKSLVRGLSQFRAKKVLMNADQDFKIDGERIHLG